MKQARQDQYTTTLDDVDPEFRFVIVGGDFNSFTKATVQELEDAYEQAGFVRVSRDSGPTVAKAGFEISTDHIFAKGLVLEETGTMKEATASDHLPVWVVLMLK